MTTYFFGRFLGVLCGGQNICNATHEHDDREEGNGDG